MEQKELEELIAGENRKEKIEKAEEKWGETVKEIGKLNEGEGCFEDKNLTALKQAILHNNIGSRLSTQTIQELNDLLNLVVQDLLLYTDQMVKLSQNQKMAEITIATLLKIAEKKELFTEEEFQKVYREDIYPTLKFTGEPHN